MEGQNVTLFADAEVQGGYTLFHANRTLQLMEGSKVRSYRENTCNLDVNATDMFVCIERNSLQEELTPEYLTDRFNKQFPHQEKLPTFTSVLSGLMHNYTNYFISNNELLLLSTMIEGPRIGVCATNITMQDSSINASGHGCMGDEGIGRGQ